MDYVSAIMRVADTEVVETASCFISHEIAMQLWFPSWRFNPLRFNRNWKLLIQALKELNEFSIRGALRI